MSGDTISFNDLRLTKEEQRSFLRAFSSPQGQKVMAEILWPIDIAPAVEWMKQELEEQQ